MVATILRKPTPDLESPHRRDFLYVATSVVAGVGVGASVWPLIDQMNPDAATLAAGGPVDIDVSSLALGQQMVVNWREHPVFIVRRTPAAIEGLRDPALIARLSDPDSKTLQQPAYAENGHRSLEPEFLVLVGVCTHLGCVPQFTPKVGDVEGMANWPGGYFCHCHGSKYDLAGRVFRGVPAPYNLPVPPYRFVRDGLLRIGENPPGKDFDFGSVVQI